MSYGELTDEMQQALTPLVDNRTIYDLGAGDLTHSHILAALGAAGVIAVDKAPMPAPKSPKVSRLQGHFGRLAVPDHIDVAFLGWPQTYPMPGLFDWLDAAEVVVYLGHNSGNTYCGRPELFLYMTQRALIDEVLGARNTLLVLGDWLAEPRAMTGEEEAYFSRD